jgi:hypothetical protein
VVVRYDGSATAKYPNGNLAISIDPDGFDYEGEPVYRLYAGFRKDGGVACSFDSAGNGFANFGATGSTCFTHNTDSGGFSMATDGGMEHAWSGHAGTRGGSTEVVESGNADNGDGGAADPPLVIVKQLDEHLLLRYSTDPAVPTELFFRCGSVKHKFVHGKNPTMETWDPDDEFLFAEKKKKKRHEKTFELPAGHVLPSSKGENDPYTTDDQLKDIVRCKLSPLSNGSLKNVELQRTWLIDCRCWLLVSICRRRSVRPWSNSRKRLTVMVCNLWTLDTRFSTQSSVDQICSATSDVF